jgi:hypothetical protein
VQAADDAQRPAASRLPVPVTPVMPFCPARRAGEKRFTLQNTTGSPVKRASLFFTTNSSAALPTHSTRSKRMRPSRLL